MRGLFFSFVLFLFLLPGTLRTGSWGKTWGLDRRPRPYLQA